MNATTLDPRIIARVLAIWPAAIDLQATRCHCRKRALMVSFVLPEYARIRNGEEECGYFCTACPFSNAGTRPLKG